MSNIYIKILVLFWLLVVYSLPTTAQLKYRAKKDFGLNGNIKKVVKQEIIFSHSKDLKTEVIYYFSKLGRLDSSKENRINGLLKLNKTYRYFADKIIENNSLEPCINTVHFFNSIGNIIFQTTFPSEHNFNRSGLSEKNNAQYSNYTYSSKGQLESLRKFSPEKDTLSTIHNTYNEKMLLIKQVTVNKVSSASSYSDYEYDSLNRVVCIALFLDDKIQSKKSFIYNKGFTIELLENFHPRYNSSLTSEINSYDIYENKIETKTIGEDLTTHSLITYQIEYYH